MTTAAEQRANNIHVYDGITEAEFVKMRTARDKTLSMPVLILHAIQVNVRAGQLPAPEDNGVVYFKIQSTPFNYLAPANTHLAKVKASASDKVACAGIGIAPYLPEPPALMLAANLTA